MEKKGLIKKTLLEIIQDVSSQSEEFEWFNELLCPVVEEYSGKEELNGRSVDEDFFRIAYGYPEFHPLTKKAIKAIMKVNLEESIVWSDDEEHAGTFGALLFALEDKKDIPFYVYFLASTDFDHFVYQPEDWDNLFNKWGICEETLLLMAVILMIPGQPSLIKFFVQDSQYWREFISYVQKKENMELFLKQAHVFSRKANKMGARIRNLSDVLYYYEHIKELFTEALSIDEGMLSHMAKKFDECVENKNSESPTLAMLKEGYNN